MVAAANPLATRAGVEILRAGGSAVDAAVAVQLVLGLVEPQSSGLGGGAFLLHWDAGSKQMTSYDGREAAPATAKPDRFMVAGRPMAFKLAVKSSLSIGVPGTVKLLEHAHGRHGRLGWARLFRTALDLAENGFPVSRRLHSLLASAGPASFDDAMRSLYFDPEGRARPAGYRLTNPAYAKTLQLLAKDGASAFYGGQLASQIVSSAAVADARKGSLSLSDLESYSVVERPPVCVSYRKNQVCSMGPPSSGAHTIGQVLLMLGSDDLGTSPRAAMTGGGLHLVSEALKLAFADRNRYLADPAFTVIPVGMLDPIYLRSRRALIPPDKALPSVAPGTPPGAERQSRGLDATNEAAGTSHISIVDASGNVVSMTTTIESAFGSGHSAGGFLLNNELTDFSFRPVDKNGRPIANRVEGGKRPRSSMSPTIVLDEAGKPIVVTGSAGGSRIIPYVLKALIATLDWKMDAAAALSLPNFGNLRPGPFDLEEPQAGGFEAYPGHPASALGVIGTALRLKGYGHAIKLGQQTSGTQLIVRRPDGALEGAADPRREGAALGD